jgi:hypothetical protein
LIDDIKEEMRKDFHVWACFVGIITLFKN